MRPAWFHRAVVGAAILMIAGCAQNVARPRDTALPSGVTVSPNETIHGVLSVPGPGQVGVQGSTEPFFTDDSGTIYALQLGSNQDALRDPASSGRSLTLTGDVLTRDPVPVGESEKSIVVTDFQFDHV